MLQEGTGSASPWDKRWEQRNAPPQNPWGRSCWAQGTGAPSLTLPLPTRARCQLQLCTSVPAAALAPLRAGTLPTPRESPRDQCCPEPSQQHLCAHRTACVPQGCPGTSLRECPRFGNPPGAVGGKTGCKESPSPCRAEKPSPRSTILLHHSQQASKGFVQGQKQEGREGRKLTPS